MDPSARQAMVRVLLSRCGDDPLLAREMEAYCHSTSTSPREYAAQATRCLWNLHSNPSLGSRVLLMDDSVLAEATTVGYMERDRLAKRERFEKMLADKYDSLNDESFQAIVKCQRCGSNEIRWEEKQTRSADEGATVFCTCLACKNRWVLR